MATFGHDDSGDGLETTTKRWQKALVCRGWQIPLGARRHFRDSDALRRKHTTS